MNEKELKIYTENEVLKSSTEYFKGDEMAAEIWMNKYCLKGYNGELYEKNPDDMHKRLASEFARIELKYPNPISYEQIYELIKNFTYIVPQGSPMAGIGNNFQFVSLSNCFVIGNEKDSDSYGGILKLDQELVQLQKRRAGVGNDLTFIRPSGSIVKNSALTSTGVPPFMERFSNSTREVAQDGRRGALMLSISIKHPDAEQFIDAKMEKGKVTGANISVKLDDKFMEAALNKEKYAQTFPVNSEEPRVKKEIDAASLWEKIVYNAWASAEPGILFWDTIIKESIPDCYQDLGFKTISTNPCGEIPLCANDSCRLISINLYSYVENPFTKDAKFNFDLFVKHVTIAMRMMDDLVDLELEKIDKILTKIDEDPEEEFIKTLEKNLWINIKKKAQEGRRTGLGITAEGDMLAALGLIYGTDEATEFSVKVHKTLKLEAYRSSVIMAKERGKFPLYDCKREESNPFIQRIKNEDSVLYNEMKKSGRRNIALLTIAPAGTTSLMTQTTSGIEPVFKVVYKRRRKINPQEKDVKISFIDPQGDKWLEYIVFHHKFEDFLNANGYNAEEVKKMSDLELNEVIRKSPFNRATSDDVDWVKKVEMQGKVQKEIDHSISCTVNMPKDTTKETVSKVYEAAWKAGCKGVTVYRDGSRKGVLVSKNEEVYNHAPKRPKVVEADVVRFQNQYEQWMAVVGKIDGFLYEIFTGKLDSFVIPGFVVSGKVIKNRDENGVSRYDFQYKDKDGYDVTVAGLSRSFDKEYWNYAKLISGVLRHRMPVYSVVKLVESLKLDDDILSTWKNGVTRVLRKYIPEGTDTGKTCKHCGAKVVYTEGCEKCLACGKHNLCG